MSIEGKAQHVAESQVFGQDHQAIRLGVLEDCLVRASAQTDVANVFDFKAFRAK
jgi:hypothetical protein